MVGLDVAELEEQGFMDGFASVLSNLSDPGKGADTGSRLDAERRRKVRALNEQVKFRLPPYFVLILRAFSVIEGIALKVDPQYAIITETFPYLSRRLLTDENPEVRKALRQVGPPSRHTTACEVADTRVYFARLRVQRPDGRPVVQVHTAAARVQVLYGDGKRMDLSRFRTLFDSLQSFTTDGLTAKPATANAATAAAAAATRGPSDRSAGAATTSAAAGAAQGAVLDKNLLLALQSVFNAQGTSYLQQLLVSELAATLESLSRGAAVSLLQSALQSSLTSGSLALVNRLGPLRQLLLPFPVPAEIIASLGDVVTLTDDDHVAINNVQTVWGLLQPQLARSIGGGNLEMSLVRSFASTVGDLPGETRASLVAGAGRTSQMVVEKVLQRTAARFAEDLASVRTQQGALDGILGGSGGLRGGMPAGAVAGMQADKGVMPDVRA